MSRERSDFRVVVDPASTASAHAVRERLALEYAKLPEQRAALHAELDARGVWDGTTHNESLRRFEVREKALTALVKGWRRFPQPAYDYINAIIDATLALFINDRSAFEQLNIEYVHELFMHVYTLNSTEGHEKPYTRHAITVALRFAKTDMRKLYAYLRLSHTFLTVGGQELHTHDALEDYIRMNEGVLASGIPSSTPLSSHEQLRDQLRQLNLAPEDNPRHTGAPRSATTFRHRGAPFRLWG